VSEGTQDRIRVDHAPSRCPYCHEDFVSLEDVVACAACGARHHAECHAQDRRCATCGSTDVLVHVRQGAAAASAARPRAPFFSQRLLGQILVLPFLLCAWVLPLLILASALGSVFFPAGSPHAKGGSMALSALAVVVAVVAVLVRNARQARGS
jgi:hypothetical protein